MDFVLLFLQSNRRNGTHHIGKDNEEAIFSRDKNWEASKNIELKNN